MNLSQFGLLLDVFGALILGFESWIKLRTIQPNSIQVGYGQVGIFWRALILLGWPLVIGGFILQFIGSAK